ncbi:hypothetical protein GCM10017557_19290 [Streptomyces aurantiacus]|uniref:Uncharacterized protein n=1 Tax=Streptomyces aurantiacus TaxID=47760 RepID=A0A7G1NZI9_9ACTN|nr:hypothetical protein GCM10017557_19290 [Streptomyces aurantiacus]
MPVCCPGGELSGSSEAWLDKALGQLGSELLLSPPQRAKLGPPSDRSAARTATGHAERDNRTGPNCSTGHGT